MSVHAKMNKWDLMSAHLDLPRRVSPRRLLGQRHVHVSQESESGPILQSRFRQLLVHLYGVSMTREVQSYHVRDLVYIVDY